jgi:hypothetical protein
MSHEVDGEPLNEVLAPLGLMASPCQSVGKGAVEVAEVEGETLAEVLARLRLMSPKLTASPLLKCWHHQGRWRAPCRSVSEGAVEVTEVEGEPLAKCGEGAVDVAEVDGEPLAKVLALPGSMARVPSPDFSRMLEKIC